MKDWRKVLISPNTAIRDAIKVIDEGALQIALVVDANQRLLGTVTDGDVRRGILKSIPLDAPASQIMNASPTTARIDDSRESILVLLKQKSLHQIPVVDQNGRVTGLEALEGLLEPETRENLVVIMAGGLGSRLRPLTNDCPKPMLKVGGRPILETILQNFLEYGFRKFCFAVNYKAEIIREYFGDGAQFGCAINYLHENEPLGTAGALSLLPSIPEHPIVVMNGDVLTKVDFKSLLDFHYKHDAHATMCVREYDIQVPYGVVRVDQHRLQSIEEKPVHRFFINAGVYVLNPDSLKLIEHAQHCDMPSLFSSLVNEGLEVAVFPVREYWLDLGKVDDFNRAQGDYLEIFG